MKLKESQIRTIIQQEIKHVLIENRNTIEIGSVVRFTKDVDIANEGDIAIVVDESRQDFDWEVLLKKDVDGDGTFGELSADSDEIEPTGKVLDSYELDKLYRGYFPKTAGLNKVDPDNVPDDVV